MSQPRTLVLSIVATAIAFAVALGSVLVSPALDSGPTESASVPARQVALSAAPLDHLTTDE